LYLFLLGYVVTHIFVKKNVLRSVVKRDPDCASDERDGLANSNGHRRRRVDIRSVRLLQNASMLYGMLLPILYLWTDICRHDPSGSLLRWKLLRRLLFVCSFDSTANRHRHNYSSGDINLASFWNLCSLPDEVRNQEEVQYSWG
jgi:hypothetical protein